MVRILVLGSSGSGKSTFARRLGGKLGIDVIHLDAFYWQPNWIETPQDDWNRILIRLLEGDRWVMDGNYTGSLPLRLKYSDTVVFLDLGRILCLLRCVGRFLDFRGGNRPELARGCNEKIAADFLKWIWNYPKDVKPRVMEYLENYPDIKVIFLKSDEEISDFILMADGN
jgi:adenylate kinase family enzyme